MKGQRAGDICKGMAAGLAGGLAASFVMNGVHAAAQRITQKLHPPQNGENGKGSEQESGDDSTVKAADKISRGVFGHPLKKREKKWAGPVVHYAMGGLTGAIYGAAAELSPQVTRGAGLPFGTAVWLLADEAAVPALGLSKPPQKRQPSVHAEELAAHLVYGLTTEGVRRLLSGGKIRSLAPARSADDR